MKLSLLTLYILAFLLVSTMQTYAVDFLVNQPGDAGDLTCDATCTLRDAVDDANAPAATNDTISFAAGITTITLTSEIQINNAGTLTITGPGANVLTIDGGAGTNRIFRTNSATVTIRGVTLSGGNSQGAAVLASNGTLILEEVVVQNNEGGNIQGGAVYVNGGTNHRIANSTFSGNTGFSGCAAIRADFTSLTVVNTTVSGNSTTADGAGIGAICIVGGTATFRNTTISGNTAAGTGLGGGGIYIQSSATVNLGNTIVAGNSSPGGPDLYINGSTNTFTTSGGNLIGDNSGNPAAPNTTTFPTGNPNANGDKVGTAGSVIDPLLGPLQNNGGTTPTRALLTRSPAIDAGLNSNTFDPSNSSPLLFDQRGAGFPRIVDGDGDTVETVDIGAFEVQRAPLAAGVSISGRVMTANGRGIRNVWITLTDSSGNVRTAVTSSFGYFSFDDVSAGETYIISASAKRYTFSQPTRVLSVNDGLADVDFTAQ